MRLNLLLEKIESEEIIANLQSKHGFNLWHLIRYDVLFHLRYTQNGLESPFTSSKSTFKNRLRYYLHLLFALFLNPLTYFYRLRKVEYLFLTSDVATFKNSKGKYVNRIFDYLAEQLNTGANVLSVEGIFTGKSTSPRNFPAVSYELLFQSIAKIGAIFYSHSQYDLNNIAALKSHIANNIESDPVFLSKIETRLLSRLKREYFTMKIYSYFFSLMPLKMIFLENASYNAKPGAILAAKRKNIPVVEPQHGLISENHLAYNFGPAYLKYESLRSLLPRFFLGYNQFFLDKINLPTQKIVIGNPHLSCYLDQKTGIGDSKEKTLLFTTAGCSTESVNDFISELYPWCMKNNYNILLRPHPSELQVAMERYPVLKREGVHLDSSANLYNSISSADIMIGEYSTVLFEALIFHKPVFLFKNNFYDTLRNESDIFPSITSGEVEHLNDLLATYPTRLMNQFWEGNWKTNFNTFIQDALLPTNKPLKNVKA